MARWQLDENSSQMFVLKPSKELVISNFLCHSSLFKPLSKTDMWPGSDAAPPGREQSMKSIIDGNQ